jgi:hypothetical protein
MANGRNLTGNRDADGNLMTADPAQDMFENIVEERAGENPPKEEEPQEEEGTDYVGLIKALMEATPEDVDSILTDFDSTATEIRDSYSFEEDLKANQDVLKFIHTKARYEDELAKITTEVPEPKGMMKTTLEP